MKGSVLMNVDVILLAISVGVLLLPARFLYPKVARERLPTVQSSGFHLEAMCGTWQNWVDLVRGFAGTMGLLGALAARSEDGERSWWTLAVLGGILFVGTALQTVHFRKVFYFTAPVFYIWGLTLALTSLPVACFAIFFSAVFSRMFNHVELKFPFLALLLAIAGYMISGLNLHLALACAIVPIPLVVTYISMGNLVCYHRRYAHK